MPAITSLRQAELTALSKDGRISKSDAQDIVKAAKADGTISKEEKQILADIFAHDAFDKGAAKIIKAAAAKPVESTSTLAGTKLGSVPVNGKTMEVVVSKELGDTKGYDNQEQAIGQARAQGGNRPTTVIQTKDGKWHAVQTNLFTTTKDFKPANNDFQAMKGLHSADPKAYAALQKDAAAKAAEWKKDPSNETKRAAAEQAYAHLATAAWGVDSADVKVIRSTKDMDPSKLNIMLETPHGEAYFGNANGNADRLPAEDKEHAQKAGRAAHGMVFGPMAFTSYEHANGVLLHEATHKAHFDLANSMLTEWKGLKNPPDFKSWAYQQMEKGRITFEEFDAVTEQRGAGDMHGKQTTEVGAAMREFFATFGAMPVDHPYSTKSLGDINEDWNRLGAKEEGQLLQRFDAFYTTLDEAHRAAFDQYMAKAPKDSIFGRYEKASKRERYDASVD